MGKLLIRYWRVFCSAKNGGTVGAGSIIKKKDSQAKEDTEAVIFDLPEEQLMDKPSGAVAMPGSKERQFVNLSDMQKKIIEERRFDLLDGRVKPTSASLSEREIGDNLISIDLGKLNVQSHNEILLENVDPEQIPDDMDIVFRGDKRIVLVGKLQERDSS